MEFSVYRLVNDANEVLDQVVANEGGDNICIGGHGNDGKYYQYDSYEAWHAAEHFREKNVGLRIESITMNVHDSVVDAQFKAAMAM